MIITCLISNILIICFQCGEKMQGLYFKGKTFFKRYLTHERAMVDIKCGGKLQIKRITMAQGHLDLWGNVKIWVNQEA